MHNIVYPTISSDALDVLSTLYTHAGVTPVAKFSKFVFVMNTPEDIVYRDPSLISDITISLDERVKIKRQYDTFMTWAKWAKEVIFERYSKSKVALFSRDGSNVVIACVFICKKRRVGGASFLYAHIDFFKKQNIMSSSLSSVAGDFSNISHCISALGFSCFLREIRKR
jgi:hypothetical protein